jgi:hypothetical protein
MSEKHKIKPEVLLLPDPRHMVLWGVEAPSSEATRDFIHQGGLERFNGFKFFMASSIDEITNWTEGLPRFYLVGNYEDPLAPFWW